MSGTRKPGRRRDEQKAVLVLDAGWSLFLEHGVEATAIEAIAAKAGVSKVTLYSHYPNKAALFEAAVLREMERIEAAQAAAGAHAPEGGLADRLTAFGMALMAFLGSQAAIDFYNAIAGELRRHPALARLFYDNGPGRTKANLARMIAAAVASGELQPCDPDQAAETLFGQWQGFSNFQFALEIDVEAVKQAMPNRVATAVADFIRLHAAQD